MKKTPTTDIQEAELIIPTFDPKEDTLKAKQAADQLKEIVKSNNWITHVNGKEHLMFEAWQTLGKYYGYTVDTGAVETVEVAGVPGFKATATVIDNKTGFKIGGAEAFCMRDEINWRAKPLFQLASMAQTRAGSKALRQILSFVVALAGYSPTPAEEMVEDSPREIPKITQVQITHVYQLLDEKRRTTEDLENALAKAFKGKKLEDLTFSEGRTLIQRLMTIEVPEMEIDLDEAERVITQSK